MSAAVMRTVTITLVMLLALGGRSLLHDDVR
jgi:hypothetical protein